MAKSTILIEVELDNERVPQDIQWQATESSASVPQPAKALMLSLWDSRDKTALRIDLWTQQMMVDEMGDFYYQTLMTMADTLDRATRQAELVDEMKQFAKNFYARFREAQVQQNKLE